MPAEVAEAPASVGRLTRFLLYGASRTLIDGVSGVRGLTLAVLLGPEAFGVWALFRLICRYGALLNLGICPGIEIEVIRVRAAAGTGGAAEGARFGRAAATYIWGLYGVGSLGLLAASFLVTDPEQALVLRWASAGLVTDRLWNYSRAYLRVVSSLRWYAITDLWYALFQLVLTCGGAWLWGLPGSFAGFILGCAFGLLLVLRDVPFRPLFSLPHLRRLIGAGMPVLSLTLLMLGLTTVDRFVVAALGGTALLGTYSFAVAVAGVGASLAFSIRTVVVPDVYAESSGPSTGQSHRHLQGTLKPFALLFPILLGFLAIAIGPGVHYLAPQYREAIPVAQLFVFNGVTAGMSGLGVLPVVASGRQRAIPAVAAATFLVNGAFASVALSAGWSLWVVAAGALAARTLLAAGILRLANGIIGESSPGWATLKMLAPLAWCCVAATAILASLDETTSLGALLAFVLYALCVLPWVPAALRELRRARMADA